jgi:hypothetical protein
LQYASSSTRGRSAPPKRSRRREQSDARATHGIAGRVVRGVGTTIKWTVILGALALIALVVAVIVGVVHEVNKSEKNSRQVSPAKYAQVKVGMTRGRIRRLLGKPEDTNSIQSNGFAEECWTYGVLARSGTYEFCFEKGRLTTKSFFKSG